MTNRRQKPQDRETVSIQREMHDIDGALQSGRPFDQSERAQLVGQANIANTRARHHGNRELWTQTAALLHDAVAAAYPPGFWDVWDRLKAGDASNIELAVRFLEDDPWFFRSGYVKADLIRMINRVDVCASDAKRLRRIVMNVVECGDRREFRSYCRLAKKVDSPDLRASLCQRLTSSDPGIKRRSRWVLDALGVAINFEDRAK